MPKSWYVAVTDWQRETVAERALRVAGFEAFNPRCGTKVVRWGRQVVVAKPYVPGYLFVRFDAARRPDWQNGIADARRHGVKRLICNTSETPTRIRQSVMDELFARCDGQVVDSCVLDEIALRHMPVGSRIKVMAGPFMGFEATVELTTEQRITALVSIFGRQTSLELAPADAEPV